jgi:ribosomal protein L7/L12
MLNNAEDVHQLRTRVARLEARVKQLYEHLRLEYTEDAGPDDPRVLELLKKGNKVEAIKIYREIYDVGLTEAKLAVDDIEARLRK